MQFITWKWKAQVNFFKSILGPRLQCASDLIASAFHNKLSTESCQWIFKLLLTSSSDVQNFCKLVDADNEVYLQRWIYLDFVQRSSLAKGLCLFIWISFRKLPRFFSGTLHIKIRTSNDRTTWPQSRSVINIKMRQYWTYFLDFTVDNIS